MVKSNMLREFIERGDLRGMVFPEWNKRSKDWYWAAVKAVSITEEEKEKIEQLYYEGGTGWLYDGEHDWQVEDDYLVIDAPYQVSLCEEDGTVIEENVKLKPRPDPSTSWPFSTDFPKDSEQGG